MKLSQLDLKGLGHFEDDKRAGFTITSPDLPTGWDYVLQNRKLLLRVDQHGPIYAQVDPPSGIILFRRDQFQRDSSWLVWLNSPDFDGGGFSNFFRPLLSACDSAQQPEDFQVSYVPAGVSYTVQHQGVRCVTEFFLPAGQVTIGMKVTVTNRRRKAIDLSAFPALRTYVNPAMLAPWDRSEWYLKTSLVNTPGPGFMTQLLTPSGEHDKRRTVALWTTKTGLKSAEISYEHFIGQGSFEKPQSVQEGSLRMRLSSARHWGTFDDKNTLYGYPPINAFQYQWKLARGQSRSFRQVLTLVPQGPAGALPTPAAARKTMVFLDDKAAAADQAKTARRYEQLIHVRQVHTPDEAFNSYANQWVPLQMEWVCSLDRGWPSGMRGSRDSAQDFTGIVPLDPNWAGQIIRTLMSVQRSDGWFPRQYSGLGRTGKHDLRDYVDAGCWVIELLHDYLCFSKDWSLLHAQEPWLDKDDQASIWDHAVAAMEYYIRAENVGEHGLCKIRGGEWLDSLSKAGPLGRGEAVMTTNQAIVALTQMGAILTYLKDHDKKIATGGDRLIKLYRRKAEAFRAAIRKHAFNKGGYFSSVFNDGGKWLFSDKDPDGAKRVYGPANWYSIIAGVAQPDRVDAALSTMKALKCADGYRLMYPPMGAKPIAHVGRAGSGDQPMGLWENGTVYNHGSHGFLARALAAAGRGDELYQVLLYLMPYDQAKHPVKTVMTPPYAIVNCYQEVSGFKRRGGMLFLTGSIGYALRGVYDWMVGIKPLADGLAVDPCVPAKFDRVTVSFTYLKRKVELEIRNPKRKQAGVTSMTLNGQEITTTRADAFNGRTLFVADDGLFTKPVNRLVVTL